MSSRSSRRPTVRHVTLVASSSDAAASTQADISAEIDEISSAYDGSGETQPRLDYSPYRSSLLRHPTKALQPADPEGVELWAPVFGERDLDPLEADLTIQHRGDPQGEGIVVT